MKVPFKSVVVRHDHWRHSFGGVVPMFTVPLANSRLAPLILAITTDLGQVPNIVSALAVISRVIPQIRRLIIGHRHKNFQNFFGNDV
jgi:hypothetical protein